MKSNYPILAAIMMASVSLSGCASQKASVHTHTTPTTAEWKIGEYTVVFRAGPREYETPKSFSSYEITRKFESLSYPSSIAAESAQSLEWFQSNPTSTPSENIKLSTSSSGKTLLIVEEVPNDCGPCTNWILVRGDGESLIYDYLVLPYQLPDPSDIFGETPTVTKITENEISFRYSDGKKHTVPVKSVVKAEKRPTFPG